MLCRSRPTGSGTTDGSGLGTIRWVIERTNAWIHGFRRLRIRWDVRDDIHEAFLKLARCIITYRRVRRIPVAESEANRVDLAREVSGAVSCHPEGTST